MYNMLHLFCVIAMNTQVFNGVMGTRRFIDAFESFVMCVVRKTCRSHDPSQPSHSRFLWNRVLLNYLLIELLFCILNLL